MRNFSLLIKPVSADCNLDCRYCFYKRAVELYPDSPRHRMPDEVLEHMIEALLSYRFNETMFGWQGGEPTLAGRDFFERVVELQQQHGGRGQRVGNGLQTNGVLIDNDWATFLAKYRFLVGLSLDGPQEIHDHYRVNYGGSGSWEKTMAAAETMRSHGVSFNILTVINRHNESRAREIYAFFREQKFDFLQFIPCVERDPETGEIAEFSVTPDGYGRFLTDLFEVWKEDGFPEVSIRDFDSLLSHHLHGRTTICTHGAYCDSYLLVEHNGDVYPCDFFAYDDWRLGNLMERPLHEFFETERAKTFARQKIEMAAVCRDCDWVRICRGGCQKDRWIGFQDYAAPSYFCEGLKAFHAATAGAFPEMAEEIRRINRASEGAAPQPAQSAGRNDPCPCGSGKKFKRCCGAPRR